MQKPVKPVNTETTMRCDTIDPAVLDFDLQTSRRQWQKRSPGKPDQAKNGDHNIRP